MRSVVVEEKSGNKRIDRFLKETFPNAPASAIYKALRKKDVKVNGIRVKDDYVVMQGDKVEVYLVDEIIDGVPIKNSHALNRGFSIVYEDKNLIIVNKEQGIPVHPDRGQLANTLIDQVRYYLSEKDEYNQKNKPAFQPSLCHRLDRNTGGLVIIAKNNESLKILLSKIRNKEIKKYYQCLVKGKMENSSSRLRAFLYKDENKGRVFISDTRSTDYVEIITGYRVLSYNSESDISLLEVELITGRTHQIRAHLAFIGHPIIGDGKYGLNSINRAFSSKYQALWATKIIFDFRSNGRILDYLRKKKFEVKPQFSFPRA